jgi:Ricin-type beta-trefoil lectin domain
MLAGPIAPASASEQVNAAHGLCLDAAAQADGSNGDGVQLWSCNAQVQQQWYLRANPSGGVEFVNGAHSLCLDANAQGDGSNGDRVQLWSCWGGPNQSWIWRGGLPFDNTTAFELQNLAHGLCLDANAQGDGSNGDTVMLWSCWGGLNQYWAAL